jgi:hypothetical protein
MADKCLRKENHLDRYERFWNYSAKVAASKKPKATGHRLNVKDHYPGDEIDTIVGVNAKEFLESVYRQFFDLKTAGKGMSWPKFHKRKQDLELKHARRNANRELTMRERHLLHILRCQTPVGKDGQPINLQTWIDGILISWSEPRDSVFQAHVDKQAWKVFDGETFQVDPSRLDKASKSASSLSEEKPSAEATQEHNRL